VEGLMLAIVPARGGSKGIPRKNLRNVGGVPLLIHTLRMLEQVSAITHIVVSTDDAEIAAVAYTHGFEVVDRPPRLAQDDTTIAEVVEYTVELLRYNGCVGVFQPTSPTLSPETVAAAIREFHKEGVASLGSVVADTKLRWKKPGVPLYQSRVNRQQLEPEWRETGGIQLARSGYELVGEPHGLFALPADEAHDIDKPDDLETARRHLAQKRIEFHVAAGQKVGAGHVYRCLALADEVSHHRVRFADLPTAWAQELVHARGHHAGGWAHPDLVVFDTLDTTERQVADAKAAGAKVITLEDLGAGARLADATINELYAVGECGPKWSVLRPEFLGLPPNPVREEANRVLVMFGGTDPAHLSERVARIAICEAQVTVLVGPAASTDECGYGIKMVREAPVAKLIRDHDLVVTSAGRTVHEAAACGVPVLSIAANERESRHSHCPGIARLGLHVCVADDAIQGAVRRLLKAPALRAEMAGTARAAIDGLGARRFAHLVDGLLEGL
jgi:CMP-N-acetylneuraminic acid synthetase/spore coat polysaccharide biosynthesis predicted glycosyltransferase SpsG